MLEAASIDAYYFNDPRLILVPIEQLSPAGMSAHCAALVRARRGWSAGYVDLFNAAFALYWQRVASLASRARQWCPPRLRHVAVVTDPLGVRPYVQLLNTSAWLLYEGDIDPARSHPEFAAYLLVHGDRMALTGEVTRAAVHDAAYWFDRRDDECAAFAAAAARSDRPDAEAFRALAAAMGWLRQLHHETLRPPAGGAMRPIPGSGLLVPRALDSEPPRLNAAWTQIARTVLARYHDQWRAADLGAVRALCDWLVQDGPPLLVTGAHAPILWSPDHPDRLGSLRGELRHASGVAVGDLHADLQVVAARTRTFLAALTNPDALPPPPYSTEQHGFAYLHRDRRLLAYNLYEPGFERLRGPSLPYARAMLGARAMHEWAHLAVDAGWVPLRVPADELARRTRRVGDELDATLNAAPAGVRARTAAELPAPASGETVGMALARVLLTRMPDYQANLLATGFLDLVERETYVRHNIRALRGEYPPAALWRMLIQYLAEYQYLRFSAVEDPRTFFVRSTWFDADFFATGALAEERFDALLAAVGELYSAYAVDTSRVTPTVTRSTAV